MAAAKQRSMGESLRHEADRLYVLAERADAGPRGLVAVRRLHDDVENVAGEVRATVRGRGFTH